MDVCNGGNPRKRYFPVSGNIKVIERLLCIIENIEGDNKNGDYNVGVVHAQIFDRFNGHQVPIAALFAGDFLCFDAENADLPKIVVWDHERSREGDPVTLPVADDFTSFLSLLYADDDDNG